MTHAQTAQIIEELAASYPAMKLSEATIRVYSRELLDLDFDRTQLAVGDVIKTSKFFPTIAHIREAVHDRTPTVSP